LIGLIAHAGLVKIFLSRHRALDKSQAFFHALGLFGYHLHHKGMRAFAGDFRQGVDALFKGVGKL
jgi:hypothetical protein